MNVTLDPDVRQFLEDKVRLREFSSVNAAINSLIAQAKAQIELTPEEIVELRDEIQIGIAELDRGELSELTAEDVIAEQRAT